MNNPFQLSPELYELYLIHLGGYSAKDARIFVDKSYLKQFDVSRYEDSFRFQKDEPLFKLINQIEDEE